MVGNGTSRSALYALWEAITVVGLLLAALVLFRRRFGSPSRLGRFLAAQSFAVYVIHVCVLVGIAGLLRGLDWPVLAKAGIVSIVAVPVCFALAWAIRRAPGVRLAF